MIHSDLWRRKAVRSARKKSAKMRSRRSHDVLFRAGSLGLMNGVGIRSPQRQAIAHIIQ